jgi:hypothetical protein
MDTGMWPDGFLPKGLEMGPVWQVALVGEMANLWIEHRLKEMGPT